MENKKIKSLIILLSALTIGLTSYIVYDKITEKEILCENTNNHNQSNNNHEENVNDNNQSNDNSENNNINGVYGNTNKTGEANLLLWPDKTYKYTYKLEKENNQGHLGKYTIEDNYIILNTMFKIDFGTNTTSSEDDTAKVVTESIKMKLKIKSQAELYDENNNITLNLLNQPFGPDNDFYSNLRILIK